MRLGWKYYWALFACRGPADLKTESQGPRFLAPEGNWVFLKYVRIIAHQLGLN